MALDRQGIEAWPDQKAGVWRWAAYDGMNRQQGTGTSEENALEQARRAFPCHASGRQSGGKPCALAGTEAVGEGTRDD